MQTSPYDTWLPVAVLQFGSFLFWLKWNMTTRLEPFELSAGVWLFSYLDCDPVFSYVKYIVLILIAFSSYRTHQFVGI